MLRIFFLLIITVLLGGFTTAAAPSAPDDVPLGTPILAFDTAAQDAIWLYDLQNRTARQLSFGDEQHRVWGFSPDGCRVLFTLGRSPTHIRAYSARLNGDDVREVARFASPPSGVWSIWEPQWSPDAANPRIAFTFIRYTPNNSDGFDTDHRIAWVDASAANGYGGEPAFYSVTGDEHTARWSFDGARLIYVSYEERPAGADPFSTAVPNSPVTSTLREADIWMVDADGSNKRRVTDFPVGSVSMPRWSPDGDLIGFVYSPSPNNDQIWMIGSAAGSIPTQLSYATALALDLSWFSDSTAMVASLRDFRGAAENRLWRIPLVGIADNEAEEILSDPASSYLDYPRYSSDGRFLAFRSAYALGLMDFSGASGIENISGLLPDTFDGNTPPVWSPSVFTGESSCGGQ